MMSLVEFGDYLKRAREVSELSLEEIEKLTKIRIKYLIALEQGNLNILQSDMQLYGFVRIYAQQVGLQPDASVKILQKALSSQDRVGFLSFLNFRNKVRNSESFWTSIGLSSRNSKKNGELVQKRVKLVSNIMSLQTFVLILLSLSLTVFFFWGSLDLKDNIFLLNQRPQATPIVLGPTITSTFLSYEKNTPTSVPPLVNFSDINLTIIAEQRSFVQIIVDDVLEYQGVLQMGDRSDYYANEQIKLTTGNGKGIRVIYNQREEGIMGEFGEIVTWIFNPNEKIRFESEIFVPSVKQSDSDILE